MRIEMGRYEIINMKRNIYYIDINSKKQYEHEIIITNS